MSKLESIPTVDLRDYVQGDGPRRREFVRVLGSGLTEFGFILIEGHGVDPALIACGYDCFKRFFTLDEAVKRKYSGVVGGARGYTPFGIEHAKDYDKPDLKEFWQVGRDLPPGHPLRGEYPDNVWPEEVPGFKEAAQEIFRRLEGCAEALLEALAEHFGLPRRTFAAMIADGNHVLRILHYPPLAVASDGGGGGALGGAGAALRSAPHEDINLITLLCEATDAGLEILTRDGEWLPVESRPGQIVVDSGDMLQRLTNAVVPATTHRVVNPSVVNPSPHGAVANRSRYSIPFFVHPYSACDLTVMEEFVTPERPPRFPPITAGEYLEERLREIGLKQ